MPAASSNSVLKSRPFSGRELTDWLDSFSPPVAVSVFVPAAGVAVPGVIAIVRAPATPSETVRIAFGAGRSTRMPFAGSAPGEIVIDTK